MTNVAIVLYQVRDLANRIRQWDGERYIYPKEVKLRLHPSFEFAILSSVPLAPDPNFTVTKLYGIPYEVTYDVPAGKVELVLTVGGDNE